MGPPTPTASAAAAARRSARWVPLTLLLCASSSPGARGLVPPLPLKGSSLPSHRLTSSPMTTTRCGTALPAAKGAYRRKDDLDGDDEDITAASNNNNEENLNVSAEKKKAPTLAELEDMEDARIEALEREAAARNSNPSAYASAPSNLYSGIYDTAAADGGRAATTSSGGGGMDDGNPLNISPAKEVELAQKRDALQNGRLNEMFAEEDARNVERQEKIRALMEEDDRAWKEERRKKLMGKYAEVESWEEVDRMLGEDRKREAKGASSSSVWSSFTRDSLIRASDVLSWRQCDNPWTALFVILCPI